MRRSPIVPILVAFALGLTAGVAVPVFGGAVGAKVTNLITRELAAEFVADRQVLVDLVQIPPHETLDWHWHPGEEFHYYLDGNPLIERDDAPPIVGKRGTVGHIEFKRRHRISAGNKGAKVLVFRVHTTGAPWRYVDSK